MKEDSGPQPNVLDNGSGIMKAGLQEKCSKGSSCLGHKPPFSLNRNVYIFLIFKNLFVGNNYKIVFVILPLS